MYSSLCQYSCQDQIVRSWPPPFIQKEPSRAGGGRSSWHFDRSWNAVAFLNRYIQAETEM